MNLILAENLKSILVTEFSSAKKVIIVSAYLTYPAVILLLDSLNKEATCRVVVRARPQDVLSGATDIRAIRLLYENGICCYINRSLHAKLYVINNIKAYIGSSNFTSNGLKISSYGNIELSTLINIELKELELINKIIEDSILITHSVLLSLEKYIEENKIDKVNDCNDEWWDSVLNINTYNKELGLFIADLPWCSLNKENVNDDILHDDDIFSYKSTDNIRIKKFRGSKIYLFIKHMMKENDLNYVYFGQVTEWVHSSLKDDIVPRRAVVKNYVSNLYTYITHLAKDEFLVDKPNHSQRIIMR
jgi:hypothetical protein